MNCKIIQDKTTDEQFLIPGCMSVSHNWGADNMTDREIIKMFCTCGRKKVEKYEVHTKDEVVSMIEKLELKIVRQKEYLLKMENELDCIKSEVFFLNTIEIV